MAHSQNEKCCDFCKIGRVAKRSLRIAFRQDANLGYVSCLANIPIGVCDRCGCKNWNHQDAVRVNTSSFYPCIGALLILIQTA